MRLFLKFYLLLCHHSCICIFCNLFCSPILFLSLALLAKDVLVMLLGVLLPCVFRFVKHDSLLKKHPLLRLIEVKFKSFSVPVENCSVCYILSKV